MSAKAVPETRRFVQLGGGVLLFHLLNSVLQEAVFHLKGFNHTIALTFLQTLGIAFFALLELQVRLRDHSGHAPVHTHGEAAPDAQPTDVTALMTVASPMYASPAVAEGSPTAPAATPTYTFCWFKIERKAPLATYYLLSILSTISALLTNEASHLLNYPTQVVFKSSKLFFVMSIRLLLRMASKKSVAQIQREFLSCLLIVLGLVTFTYATSSKKSKETRESETAFVDTLKGVVAIIVALCCDAFLYIGEEKYCFDQYKASSGEVILFTYAFSALNAFITLVGTGGVLDAVGFTMLNPIFPVLVVGFSVCNFCGTHFLLGVVSEFDSNAAVIVTSTRKMFTVLLSFLIYPKPFTLLHFGGLVGVSMGIFVYEYTRISFKAAAKAAESHA